MVRSDTPMGARYGSGFAIGDVGNTRRRTRWGAVTDHVNGVGGLEAAEEILEADERNDDAAHLVCL